MPSIELRHQCCMEYMASLPDKAFSLAIVDPPYGIGYGRRKSKTARSRIVYKPKDWDSAIPTDEYFAELFRVSSDQIIWGGNYFSLGPSRGFVAWDKCQPEGLDQAMCEFAWTSFDRSAQLIRTSIQQIQFTRIHPTQKPVALYRWLLKNYAKPGERILDTHLGSGSIAIACDIEGFDLVGCEIDADYIAGARKRLADHLSAPRLFDAPQNDHGTQLVME